MPNHKKTGECKENLYCDVNCKCVCHQKDYPLPKDFPIPPKIEKIAIIPSPRIDYCGDCKKEHGYNCPKDMTPFQKIEEEFDKKFTIISHDKNQYWNCKGAMCEAQLIPKIKSFLSTSLRTAYEAGEQKGYNEGMKYGVKINTEKDNLKILSLLVEQERKEARKAERQKLVEKIEGMKKNYSFESLTNKGPITETKDFIIKLAESKGYDQALQDILNQLKDE